MSVEVHLDWESTTHRVGVVHAATRGSAVTFEYSTEWLARPGAGSLWIEPRAAPRWARRTCTAEDLAWAEAVLAGTWAPLGGERFQAGMPPQWRLDRYSGAVWPLGPASAALKACSGAAMAVRSVSSGAAAVSIDQGVAAVMGRPFARRAPG